MTSPDRSDGKVRAENKGTMEPVMAVSELIEALRENNEHLTISIETSDWDQVREDVEERGRMFQALSGTLDFLQDNPTEEEALSGRRRLLWTLEDLQATNEQFLNAIRDRVSSLRNRIREIKRGRKALGLYRRPSAVAPRFLNRLG